MKNLYLIWPTDISKQSALYPPLGLASLASVMEGKGHDIQVIDLSFDESWQKMDFLYEKGGIYGISFTSSLYSNTMKCIEIIRNNDPDAKIILGGPHASVLPQEALIEMDADVVCIGEAELSFPRVVEALRENLSLDAIHGIVYKSDGDQIVITPEVEKIKNLDTLPFPDQTIFPYEQYFKAKGFRELSIITSRGCPGQCTFCQPTIEKMFGRKIRFHGTDYILDQIRLLKKIFNLDFFVISDDTFITNKKRVLEFCQKIISEKLNIFWRCQTRISLLDREIVRAMKKAGCFVLALGVESGSQRILDKLQKKIKIEDIKRVFKICHEEGMLTHAYLMIGSEGESQQTIQETRELLREIKPFTSNICVTTPYPGTHLYANLKKQNKLEGHDWNSYDHLLSSTLHIPSPDLDLVKLNAFKEELQSVLHYPFFKLKCLWKTFFNKHNLKRMVSVFFSNPGFFYRGTRLFFRSIFSKGLDLSNPKTEAYRIHSHSSDSCNKEIN